MIHDRLVTLRARVLLSMGLAAVAGLVGMFVIVEAVEATVSRSALRTQATATANVFGALVAQHATPSQLRLAAAQLKRERITITMPQSRPLTGGQGLAGPGAVSVTKKVGATTIKVVGQPAASTGIALELTAATGMLFALMLGSGMIVGRLLTSAIATPVEKAVAVAEKVASGDLSARMGDVGTPELHRLAVAFDAMASRLAEADQQQRQFLSDLAHEIATPLNAVTGFALGLADGSISSDADRLEAAELVEADSQRLHGLLGALRRLHQLDLAEPVEEVSFDVGGLVADIAHRLEPTARRAEVKVVSRLRSVVARGDPRLVDMAVENLALNAIRYTPAGGRVELVVGLRGSDVEVKVKDTGIGIAPEHVERIFDRLYRVDEARARATGGFGIGLALVRRAALALGGHVEVESQLRKGSEFRLVFPSAAALSGTTEPQP